MSFDIDDQSYEVVDELKIRKLLEAGTNWSFEFRKNDKYDYDLQLYRWDEAPDSPTDKELAGYVEIERSAASSDWQTGPIPEHWPVLRVPRRKVDRHGYNQEWFGPKDDIERTVYLKFNHRVDECFAVPLLDVREFGEVDYWPPDARGRMDTFYSIDAESDILTWGIEDSITRITDYLSLDHKLGEFPQKGGRR